MIRPMNYINRMLIFLGLALAFCVLFYEPLLAAFMANPALNGLILGVLLIGILLVMRQVFRLNPEVRWLHDYRREDIDADTLPTPKLLGPMATMLAERRGRVSLSTLSMRSLLDSIASRLDESRELSRYLVGLLIFLGLLGTFWGLLQTISAIGQTINSLNVDTTDMVSMFDDLKEGLQAPLSGMGTAFSSSLFGLAGSVILGLLDLFAGQAQNRFYNDLEEWLSSVTTLSAGGPNISVGEGEVSAPAYMTALLEQTAESIDKLQHVIARTEEGRANSQQALIGLAENMALLAEKLERDSGGLDEASKNHIRSLDTHMQKLAGQMDLNRTRLMDELRSEIKLLSRTIAASVGKKD